MTNFLGWELFPSGGSTVGTLGPCILLNVPKVGHTNVQCTPTYLYTVYMVDIYQNGYPA